VAYVYSPKKVKLRNGEKQTSSIEYGMLSFLFWALTIRYICPGIDLRPIRSFREPFSGIWKFEIFISLLSRRDAAPTGQPL
jgi:hypothetical protein